MIFRLMNALDLSRGFVETLSALAPVESNLDELRLLFQTRLRQSIRTYVMEDTGKVIATASLLVETKYIRKGGKAAHIEDVAVLPSRQGQGVGKELIRRVVAEAEALGCYKVILSCIGENQEFYAKCGFKVHEFQMRLDLPASSGIY